MARGSVIEVHISPGGLFRASDVMAVDVESRRVAYGTSGRDGFSEFSGLPPGTYVIGYIPLLRFVATATPEDMSRLAALTGASRVQVSGDAEPRTIDLAAVSGLAAVEGTVDGGGEPGSALIDIVPTGLEGTAAPVQPVGFDGARHFTIGSLLPGEYTVRWWGSSGAAFPVRRVVLAPGARVDVRIQPP